jgi:3-hydroxyacyl-[acyl-carrier-protein] dehydratase
MTAPLLDIHRILRKLPHRYPFLLVDKVVELEKDRRVKAIKNVTINEPFFAGHFPARPVMPGVLILEALAQAAALLSFESMGSEPGDDSVVYLVGIDGARFKRPVEPGDQLVLEASIERVRGGIVKYTAQASVDGDVAAEAAIMCTMRKVG